MAKVCPSYSNEPVSQEETPMGKSGLVYYRAIPMATCLYEILGFDSQVLQVSLPPGGMLQAEPGTMLHMTEGITRDMSTAGGLLKGIARAAIAGEALLMTKYTNNTDTPQPVGLTPNFPSKIISIDLNRFSGITIKSGAFMCAITHEVHLKYKLQRSVAAAFCGGQGVVTNTLSGTGIAFLNASGSIVSKFLEPGEELLADQNSVLAYDERVTFDVRRTGGFVYCCCSGEGLFNAVLKGPGLVILQTMPYEKIAAVVFPAGSGGGGGDGGVDASDIF